VSQSKPSKSARKRAHLALQELGVQLTNLSDEQLDAIDMDERLREAVEEARHIKSHSALRRQRQLIGKLMRQADAAAIRASLDRIAQATRIPKALFKRAETWRDRIATEGHAAVVEFARETGCDAAALRGLCDDLSKAVDTAGRRNIRRQLFREVHRLLAAEMQNEAP
jgi:ribosome-associated protein